MFMGETGKGSKHRLMNVYVFLVNMYIMQSFWSPKCLKFLNQYCLPGFWYDCWNKLLSTFLQ